VPPPPGLPFPLCYCLPAPSPKRAKKRRANPHSKRVFLPPHFFSPRETCRPPRARVAWPASRWGRQTARREACPAGIRPRRARPLGHPPTPIGFPPPSCPNPTQAFAAPRLPPEKSIFPSTPGVLPPVKERIAFFLWWLPLLVFAFFLFALAEFLKAQGSCFSFPLAPPLGGGIPSPRPRGLP